MAVISQAVMMIPGPSPGEEQSEQTEIRNVGKQDCAQKRKGKGKQRYRIRGKLRIQRKPWRSRTTGTGEGGSVGIQGEEVTEREERRSENQTYKTEGFSRL